MARLVVGKIVAIAAVVVTAFFPRPHDPISPVKSDLDASRRVLVTTPMTIPATTTTSGPTTSVPSSPIHKGRCPRFESAFASYGLLPVEVFSYIAWRESRCNPSAVNARWDEQGNIIWTLNKDGSYDTGLLQINSTWKTVTRNVCGSTIEALYQVDCNLRVAKYLLDNGGLAHWGIKDVAGGNG